MYSVLNCHNVAKYTDHYLGQLFQCNIHESQRVVRLRKLVLQMLLCGDYYERFTLKSVQTTHHSTHS
jgi:hypothetical protein